MPTTIKSENWDSSTPPALPAGWNNDALLVTSTTAPDSGTKDLSYPAASINNSRIPMAVWGTADTNSGNTQVSTNFRFDNTVSTVNQQINLLLRKKTSLGTDYATASQYEFQIIPTGTGVAGINIVRRVSGTDHAIPGAPLSGSFFSNFLYYYAQAYASGAAGTTLKLRIQRSSDGFWLNSSGTWVSDGTNNTWVFNLTDSDATLDGAGYAGILYYTATGGGTTYTDDFLYEQLSSPPALSVTPAAQTVGNNVAASITATLTNSVAGLTASTTAGTLSTTTPTSGTPFTLTTPSTGRGTATVTVTDATDSLTQNVTVKYGTATTFYVDNAGSDTNAGTVGVPWQTIGHVTSLSGSGFFLPGDTIEFTSGQTFTGALTISAGGKWGAVLLIGTTGAAPATFTNSTAAADGIRVQDCGFVTIDNITLSGPGVSSTGTHTSSGAGVRVQSTQTATGPTYYQGIVLSNLTVSGYWCPIWIQNTTGTATVGASNVSGVAVGFANIQVLNVTINDGGYRGILVDNPVSSANSGYSQVFYVTGLRIAGGNIKHVYGDTSVITTESGSGVRITGVQGGLVEDVIVEDCGSKNGDSAGGPVGAYTFLCDTITFRRIQVARQQTALNVDGDGIGFDGGSTNCVAESCVARDCVAAGFYSFTFSGLPHSNIIFRNCVGVNNARSNYTALFFSAANARAENCTIYQDATTCGRITPLFGGGSGGGTEASGSVATNCVFVALNGATVAFAGTTSVINNLYDFGAGSFSVSYGGTAYTTLATLQGAGAEKLLGQAVGWAQSAGLSAPVASQSCAQLLAAWAPVVTGTLLTGGVAPGATGSTPASFDPLKQPVGDKTTYPLGAMAAYQPATTGTGSKWRPRLRKLGVG